MNILFLAPPGSGKTEKILNQYPQAVVLLASAMCEEEVAGIPYIENGVEKRAMPPFMSQLWESSKRGEIPVLFLDEIDKARQSVSDTLLTLVHGGKCNSGSIPNNTLIFAAANPPEWGGGEGIGEALLNRFAVVDATLSIENWFEWAELNFNANVIASMLLSHLRQNKIVIYKKGNSALYQPSRTPRSITNAIDEYGLGNIHLISGIVDAELAMLILAFDKQSVEYVEHNAVIKRLKQTTASRKPVRV